MNVFAWLVVVVFSHALFHFFWYLPSWLRYLTSLDILAIASYTFAISLIESVLLLLGLLVLAALLPGKLLRQHFSTQGVILVWMLSAWALLILSAINFFLPQIVRLQRALPGGELVISLVLFGLVILSVILAPYYLARRQPGFAKGVLALNERASFFLYLYVPLGILGLAVVILRNL
jgi:hypothetical protein